MDGRSRIKKGIGGVDSFDGGRGRCSKLRNRRGNVIRSSYLDIEGESKTLACRKGEALNRFRDVHDNRPRPQIRKLTRKPNLEEQALLEKDCKRVKVTDNGICDSLRLW